MSNKNILEVIMKRIVIAVCAVLLVTVLFAREAASIPVTFKDRYERMVKDSGKEIFNYKMSKTTAKSASAYDPEFAAVLIDSSKNGFGMVSGVTNPISHSGMTFVMAYRQWVGIEETAGAIGMAYSLDGGESWTNASNINAVSPGVLEGRYPSAIGAGDYPFIAWSEYTGVSSGIENDAKPLYAIDMLGFGGGYLTTPQFIGSNASNPEGLWMGCPSYSEDPSGNGYINMTFSTWREFDSNDIGSRNIYLFRSTNISASGDVSFAPAVKIFDSRTYFEEGSTSGSTTSDALISIADNGVGYVANVAYWNDGYTVENNDYHTFKFRKTSDYGATWSEESFDDDVPYYFIPDNVFDDNIFDIFIPSQIYEVVYGTDTVTVDTLNGAEDTVLDIINFPGLFIGYDNEMIVDQNGGMHLMCLVIPESDQSGYILPTIHEGCGFYHLYSPDPTAEDAEWRVNFVTSMRNTWRFSYGNSDRAWQSFFPSMATSVENPDIIYAVYPKGNIYEEEGMLYMKSYDIYVSRSADAGVTWQEEINVTNTDDFDELNAHADPDATNENLYIVYQVPDYSVHTVDNDESDAVPEDYKNRVYFMNVAHPYSSVEETAHVPADFNLKQNYPNPFNPVTTIEFNIHQAGEYRLDVYNTLGRKVTTLFSAYRESGNYKVDFDGSLLPSGIYFYSLTGNNTTRTLKSVLLK
jgi:hypothetical protein